MENALKNLSKIIFRPINLWWLFLIAFLFFSHANNLLDSDEGIILEGAQRLIHGQKLYLDFFEFIPPASFYFILFVWKIFGVSYISAKLASLALFAIGGIGIFKIGRKIGLYYTALIPVAIYFLSSAIWPIINYNTFNAVFLIWSAYYFINFIQNSKYRWLIFSGIFCGIYILFIQHRGMALGGAVVIFLSALFIKEKNKSWWKYFLTYSLSAIAPLLTLFFWPPQIIWNNLILFPAANYWETNVVSYYLIILATAILIWLGIFIYRKNWNNSIAFLFILQTTLLIICLPRPDYFHVFLILFPFYVLLIKAYFLIKNKLSVLSYTYYAFCFIILIIIVNFCSIALLFGQNIYFHNQLRDDLVQYVNNNCESPYIYAGPFIPGVYFETEKLNATAYPFLITNQQTQSQFEDAVKDLELKKPDCAILQYAIVEKFSYDKNNPMGNYINAKYHLEKKINRLLIYKIN